MVEEEEAFYTKKETRRVLSVRPLIAGMEYSYKLMGVARCISQIYIYNHVAKTKRQDWQMLTLLPCHVWWINPLTSGPLSSAPHPPPPPSGNHAPILSTIAPPCAKVMISLSHLHALILWTIAPPCVNETVPLSSLRSDPTNRSTPYANVLNGTTGASRWSHML